MVQRIRRLAALRHDGREVGRPLASCRRSLLGCDR